MISITLQNIDGMRGQDDTFHKELTDLKRNNIDISLFIETHTNSHDVIARRKLLSTIHRYNSKESKLCLASNSDLGAGKTVRGGVGILVGQTAASMVHSSGTDHHGNGHFCYVRLKVDSNYLTAIAAYRVPQLRFHHSGPDTAHRNLI